MISVLSLYAQDLFRNTYADLFTDIIQFYITKRRGEERAQTKGFFNSPNRSQVQADSIRVRDRCLTKSVSSAPNNEEYRSILANSKCSNWCAYYISAMLSHICSQSITIIKHMNEINISQTFGGFLLAVCSKFKLCI